MLERKSEKISSSQKTSDLLLAQEAVSGEEEAFIHLYQLYVSQLYSFVYSKVNNQQDAEDLTSETFYNALRDLKNYRGKSSFKNWLFGIAKHFILAYYRQKYSENTVKLNENLAISFEAQDETKTEKKSDLIKIILGSLSQNYHDVLNLRFLKGYSIIETARELGITEENVKVLQHRALKKANQVACEVNMSTALL